MASIYIASSHKNETQQDVVSALRAEGHEVFDFRNPTWKPGEPQLPAEPLPRAFPEVPAWTALLARAAHHGARAKEVLRQDMAALEAADILVLVLPCGRGAHQELGYAIAKGKQIFILLADGEAPDLMHGMILLPDEDGVEPGEFVASIEGLTRRIWVYERSLADAVEGIAQMAAAQRASNTAAPRTPKHVVTGKGKSSKAHYVPPSRKGNAKSGEK